MLPTHQVSFESEGGHPIVVLIWHGMTHKEPIAIMKKHLIIDYTKASTLSKTENVCR